MLRKVPLIIVLGSTGTGKTKLALELAERFGGEIISADSMQVYANLNIVTAKATQEEQARIRHHLLDVATPGEPYTVWNFRNAALPILDRLLAQSKSPIVVGGTNYYIESLLWDILVSPKSNTSNNNDNEFDEDTVSAPSSPSAEVDKLEDGKSICESATSSAASENPALDVAFLSKSLLSTMSSDLLHQHLIRIDPDSAQRIHPNNKRKIVRAIEVFQQSGQTLTSILQQQRQQPGANRLGGPLRYPHTILFWLRCKQEVLNERLDKRVDSMLQQGLLREIRAFYTEHMTHNKQDENLYTKGVLQTIGFKEFIPYLEKYNVENDREIEEYLKRNGYQIPKANDSPKKKKASATQPTTTAIIEDNHFPLSQPPPPPPPGLDLLITCLDELKLVTRRYSKKQIKWINNRFLASKDRQVPDLYELDTSTVSSWNEMVLGRAVTVIDCYREGRICEVEPMPKRLHPGADLNEETSHFCIICERHFIGDFQWSLHMKSNKHKRRKEGQRKKVKLSDGSMVKKVDEKVDTEAEADKKEVNIQKNCEADIQMNIQTNTYTDIREASRADVQTDIEADPQADVRMDKKDDIQADSQASIQSDTETAAKADK